MSAASYRKFSVKVAVGATHRITRRGDFFHAITANQPFSVAWDDGAPTAFFAGLTYETPDDASFNEVLIENTGDAELNIELGIGAGGVRDGRLTLTGEIGTRKRTPEVFETPLPVSAVNGAVTTLVGINSKRNEIIVVNADAAATVYVTGLSSALAGQGLPLQAGQSLTLETTAAVRVRNDSGNAVQISFAETEFST